MAELCPESGTMLLVVRRSDGSFPKIHMYVITTYPDEYGRMLVNFHSCKSKSSTSPHAAVSTLLSHERFRWDPTVNEVGLFLDHCVSNQRDHAQSSKKKSRFMILP